MPGENADRSLGSKGRRRSAAEVDQACLSSARHLFADRGYANARMRDIAAGAGVTEAVLFRHFRSKADLFEGAVASLFSTLLTDFANGRFDGPDTLEEAWAGSRSYVAELYGILSRNRKEFLALLEVSVHEPDADVRSMTEMPAFRTYFQRAETLIDYSLRKVRHHPRLDVGTAARLCFCLIGGAVLFQQWAFGDYPLDHERKIDALTSMIVAGVFGRAIGELPEVARNAT